MPPLPFTYLITSGEATPTTFSDQKPRILHLIKTAVDNGISFVQIREKLLTAKQNFELASAAVSITAGSETLLMINGRADVAAAARADGVHLPESGLPVDVVKKAFPQLVIGTSVHSLASATAARSNGADHVIFGNIFATPGKGEPVGTGGLRAVCNAVSPLPVIAVGGIGINEIDDVLNAGAAGFAAIRFFADDANQKAALAKLREMKRR